MEEKGGRPLRRPTKGVVQQPDKRAFNANDATSQAVPAAKPDPFAAFERRGSPSVPARPRKPRPERLLVVWRLLKLDRLRKRAVARCSNRGTFREIGVADGAIASCGCVRSRSLSAESFASTVAAAEIVTARKRHWGRR